MKVKMKIRTIDFNIRAPIAKPSKIFQSKKKKALERIVKVEMKD